jgi:hypothetical protein
MFLAQQHNHAVFAPTFAMLIPKFRGRRWMELGTMHAYQLPRELIVKFNRLFQSFNIDED